jgi:hypothetical protein
MLDPMEPSPFGHGDGVRWKYEVTSPRASSCLITDDSLGTVNVDRRETSTLGRFRHTSARPRPMARPRTVS